MKLKTGDKLLRIREDRKLTQEEFAELLGMSPAAYGRIERNQTLVDVEQLSQFSKVLNIPFTELLPDTITNTVHNQGGVGSGCIFGNFYYYASPGEQAAVSEINTENQLLRERLKHMEEKLALMEQLLKAKG